jgi:DNA-binding NarL/FixJ family response regulator
VLRCLLSRRERQVLDLIGRGKTNGMIGELLGIKTPTVKNTVVRILRKLGAANRTGAYARAIELGLLEIRRY